MMANKQEVIIVDLDGTLANCEHRRYFVDGTLEKQDWRSFYESMRTDTVHDWCNAIAKKFSVIFVTGRPEEYRGLTQDWLNAHGFFNQNEHLLMRQTGDFRDDAIVKEEIYLKYIKPNYIVLFVIDDRKKVVDMWRRNGLVCLHCAEGDF